MFEDFAVGTVGNVRVVDYAENPYRAVRPQKPLVLVFSLMAGMLLGVAFVIIRKVFGGGVEDPEMIEKRINVPVYATIIHSKRQDRIYKKAQNRCCEPRPEAK